MSGAGLSEWYALFVLSRRVQYTTNNAETWNLKRNGQSRYNGGQTTATDAWTMYIYSLKSPVFKQKYPKRLTNIEYSGFPQDISIEEQSKVFVANQLTGLQLA